MDAASHGAAHGRGHDSRRLRADESKNARPGQSGEIRSEGLAVLPRAGAARGRALRLSRGVDRPNVASLRPAVDGDDRAVHRNAERVVRRRD